MKAHLSSKLAPLELSRVLSFSLPALGAVLNDPLMSLVDTACVGQVSSIELAALGPNTSIFGFASMVFHFLTVASTVQVSRAHDKNDLASKSQCISDALSLALLCGVLSPVFLFACGGTLLRVMYTPPELIVPAQNYLTIRSFALPATLVSLVGTAASGLGQRDAHTAQHCVSDWDSQPSHECVSCTWPTKYGHPWFRPRNCRFSVVWRYLVLPPSLRGLCTCP